MGEKIVVVLQIYGARANFLLFCNHQETESDLRETEIGVSEPIFTQKNIKGSMGQQYTYSTRWEKNIVVVFRT